MIKKKTSNLSTRWQNEDGLKIWNKWPQWKKTVWWCKKCFLTGLRKNGDNTVSYLSIRWPNNDNIKIRNNRKGLYRRHNNFLHVCVNIATVGYNNVVANHKIKNKICSLSKSLFCGVTYHILQAILRLVISRKRFMFIKLINRGATRTAILNLPPLFSCQTYNIYNRRT